MNARIYRIAVLVWLHVASAFAADFPLVFTQGPLTDGRVRNTYFAAEGQYETEDTRLYLLRTDGTKEVLDDTGLCVDPKQSLDGRTTYYAKGTIIVDVWKVDNETKQKTRLTDSHARWNPARGVWPLSNNHWQPPPGGPHYAKGLWACAPFEAIDRHGQVCVLFACNWDFYQGSKQQSLSFRWYRMDTDGANVEPVDFMNFGSTDHGAVLKDGYFVFSTGQMHGVRTQRWAIWKMTPDGEGFAQVLPALGRYWDHPNPGAQIAHTNTQASDGTIYAGIYYQSRPSGGFVGIPPAEAGPFAQPAFGLYDWTKTGFTMRDGYSGPGVQIVNGQIPAGAGRVFESGWAHKPFGMFNPTPSMSTADFASSFVDGQEIGEGLFPEAAPANGLIFSRRFTQGGAATRDWGIYLEANPRQPRDDTATWTKLIDEPGKVEIQGVAAVPYAAIHGTPQPATPPSTVGTDPRLAPGEPFGIVGSSRAVDWIETTTPPNTFFRVQGGNTATWGPEDPEWMAIVHQKPNEWAERGPPEVWTAAAFRNGFYSAFDERLAYFTERVPLKKWRLPDGSVWTRTFGVDAQIPSGAVRINDASGQPDGSFACKIPGDQSFTFALQNLSGENLTYAGSWHQLRAGEVRQDCNGCHQHNKPYNVPFDQTFAGSTEYQLKSLRTIEAVVNFDDHVLPILNRINAPVKAYDQLVQIRIPTDSNGWDTQHVWPMRARHSQLLIWAKANGATPAEARTIATWIDLGVLKNQFRGGSGATATPATMLGSYADTQKPTLYLDQPDRVIAAPVSKIIGGFFDPDSGVNRATFKLEVAVDGTTFVNRTADVQWNGDVFTLDLAQPIVHGSRVRVEGGDKQKSSLVSWTGGNVAKIDRRVTVLSTPEPEPPTCEEQIAALEARIAVLEAQAAANAQTIADLQTQVTTLQTKIDKAKADLE